MQIYCEHPVIIVNPELKRKLILYKTYQTPNGITTISKGEADYYAYSFPKYKYSPKRFGVTLETLDQFNVIDPLTGAIYPMYIQVPCGKCVLCKDKKAREWSFRAMCENTTSTSQPIFVTLTYNNQHLPKCGIFKEEVQLFMKRLRIRLDRLHYKHNIRYFACGEYGHYSKRPHYHMILWNFPRYGTFENIWNVIKFVEKCWSVPTGEYNTDGSPVTSQLGFVYCVPCDKGAISYVMKYMRKDIEQVSGKNPVFFLSSRKNGGIGAEYARKHRDFYRIHPDCLDIAVTDPYSGVTQSMTVPQYFKRIFYPTMSQCITKQARDAHKELLKRITIRFAMITGFELQTPRTLSPHEKTILKRYSFLNNNLCLNPPVELIERYIHTTPQAQDEVFYQNEIEIVNLCRFLDLYVYDTAYIVSRETMLEKRSHKQNLVNLNRKPLDIKEVKYNLENKQKLAYLKEKI